MSSMTSLLNSLRRALRPGLLALALAALHVASPAQTPDAAPAYEYVTVPGDTLIGLSRRLLAEPERWPELARVNALPNPNRLSIGATLRIPLSMMVVLPQPATVLASVGDARSDTGPLQVGQQLPEGSEVRTGDDGQVRLRLVDGTLLRLRSGSTLRLRESNRLRDAPVVRSGVGLENGRVEVEAAPATGGRPGFQIRTPQGVLGVRGTEFRAGADSALSVTRSEVLGGIVAVDGSPGSPGQTVGAGFGTVVDATGRVAVPVPLLPPADTAGLPTLHERPLVRFTLPAQAGSTAWTAQLATEPGFDPLLTEQRVPGPELRFAGLADGTYHLRLRAIDAQGLEGRDAVHRFVLKARPEPPLPTAPPPRTVFFGDRVDLAWAANEQAQSYRLQIATGEDFAAPLRDLGDLRANRLGVEGLAPGVYHWRLRSVRGANDNGPWGEPRSFELRPLPPVPPPPKVGDGGVSISWEGRPGQTFEFQMARDDKFSQLVLERQLDKPGIEVAPPGSGRFFIRLRARDPDGFIGPYTATQHFDVPHCLRDSSGVCVTGSGAPLLIRE